MEAEGNWDASKVDDAKKKMRKLLEDCILGKYEESKFWKQLTKDVTVIHLPEGDRIDSKYRIHSNFHIVQKGELKLCLKQEENQGTGVQDDTIVRRVPQGESLYSLFNIVAEMTGYKLRPVVYAEATEDSEVILLPIKSILNLAHGNKNFKIKLLQMTMNRLSSLLSIIHSIRGIEPEAYMESIPDVEYKPNLVANETGSSDILFDTELWGDYDKFENLSLLCGDDVTLFTREGPFNSHCLLNDPVGTVQITDGETITSVCSSIKKLLSMDESDELQQHIRVFQIPPAVEIAKRYCEVRDLVYVVEGTVIITHNKSEDNEHQTEMKEETLHGVVSVLTGEILQDDIKAGQSGCTVAFISKKIILGNNDNVMTCLSNYQIRIMSPFLRLLDFTIGCEFVEGSFTICLRKESQEPDVVFVLSGRLKVEKIRRKQDQDDEDEVILAIDYGKGDMIGVEEAFLGMQTRDNIKAVRKSEIARLPKELCHYFMVKYPQAFFGKLSDLTSMIIRKVYDIGNIGGRRKFATIVCIPLSEEVPLENFQQTLKSAFERYDTNFEVKSEDDIKKSIPGDWEKVKKRAILLRRFLGNLENAHSIICYNAQPNFDFWSNFILKQADVVFVIAEFESKPSSVDSIKNAFNRSNQGETEKALILLHKPSRKPSNGSYNRPVGTKEWMELLGGESLPHLRHFHIRCPKEMFSSKVAPSSQSQHVLKQASETDHNHGMEYDDFGRLARYILGESKGLVLGGGGARGLAHVGIIKAMKEKKIPIDAVGGTSMGAFVGASYCSCTKLEGVESHVKNFCKRMNSKGMHKDVTTPYLSLSTGLFFNNSVKEAFDDLHFEDLWIPYFNIATDVTNSKMAINTSGILWEYVRASMSLAGIVPPICPTGNDNYLLDGGSVNNLPADVMKTVHRDCNYIAAVDVSGKDTTKLYNYGNHARGSWIIYWNNVHSSKEKGRIPNLRQVITRLACISAEEDLQRVQSDPDVDYIRPRGINTYGLRDFPLYDDIKKCGHETGINHKRWEQWKKH